jgi:hypothetical protein
MRRRTPRPVDVWVHHGRTTGIAKARFNRPPSLWPAPWERLLRPRSGKARSAPTRCKPTKAQFPVILKCQLPRLASALFALFVVGPISAWFRAVWREIAIWEFRVIRAIRVIRRESGRALPCGRAGCFILPRGRRTCRRRRQCR